MTDLGLTSTQEFKLLRLEGAVEEARIGVAPPSSRDANAMMPVAVVASSGPRVVAGPSARISLANGVTIEVPSGVSPAALVRLIDAAMDVRCAGQDASPL